LNGIYPGKFVQTAGRTPELDCADVDYFKAINDTYGHLVGDRILQLLCARLRHSLRSQDTAYGGEEFVIVLRNTDCQEALPIARRLGRLVSAQPFSIDNTGY